MIVGIDLGTTNSLVAVFTEEGPVIIPNRLGKHLTPSVVSVDENGNVYVGETAQETSIPTVWRRHLSAAWERIALMTCPAKSSAQKNCPA
mgnify:CR=1 FL=1